MTSYRIAVTENAPTLEGGQPYLIAAWRGVKPENYRSRMAVTARLSALGDLWVFDTLARLGPLDKHAAEKFSWKGASSGTVEKQGRRRRRCDCEESRLENLAIKEKFFSVIISDTPSTATPMDVHHGTSPVVSSSHRPRIRSASPWCCKRHVFGKRIIWSVGPGSHSGA